jgi:hypothetical protein
MFTAVVEKIAEGPTPFPENPTLVRLVPPLVHTGAATLNVDVAGLDVRTLGV